MYYCNVWDAVFSGTCAIIVGPYSKGSNYTLTVFDFFGPPDRYGTPLDPLDS